MKLSLQINETYALELDLSSVAYFISDERDEFSLET